MHNVEYKAELRDMTIARAVCAKLGAERVGAYDQTDTYYRIPSGRLKMRESVNRDTGERDDPRMIFYDRADTVVPKLSHYTITSESEARAKYGARPLPEAGSVVKTRELWVLGDIRVHLDEVEGLGTFLELEAIVSPAQNVAVCRERIDKLITDFEHALGEPIGVGYADMLGLGEDG